MDITDCAVLTLEMDGCLVEKLSEQNSNERRQGSVRTISICNMVQS